ncbi:MAG TPA: outer membrane beta-barrel protein [Anaeromyxobacteraceae bacterium]|nr:outer membrane beta-barrel protein [Anaeromyxobacteraceae bacterium]
MSSGGTDPSMGAPVGAVDYSFFLALDLPPSGYNAGPRLAGEFMYGFVDLSPQARLSLGGRGAFAYHGGDFGNSLWILEAVPDAKLTLSLAPKLSVYGDFGLGLAVLDVSQDIPGVPALGIPPRSVSDSTIAVTFQIGGGVSYALSPNMNLLGEVRFDIYTRSGSSTFVSIPTVGLQFH